MKKLLTSAALSLALVLGVHAGTSFSSKTGATNTVVPNTNTVVFPPTSGKQLVIYNVTYRNATNATLTFNSGGVAYTQTATNTTTGVTNQVNSTNGLVVGSIMVLDRAGTMYLATLASHGQATNGLGTNIVLNTGGWGVAPQIGDTIYQFGADTQLTLAPGTNAISGAAVFVSDPGRPTLIRMGPAITPSYLQVVGEYR